jgi:hypothetical protein
MLCLRRKEATVKGSRRFTDIQTRPMEVLDLTSLTLDEVQQVVPSFEAAFQAPMAHWRLDGPPRIARRYSTYKNCPLPTPEDRLLFILVYLKTYPLQVVQGRLFGMGQQGPSVESPPLGRVTGDAGRARGDARPILDRAGKASRRGRGGSDRARRATGAAASSTRLPPCGHNGTERRLERPQDLPAQTRC